MADFSLSGKKLSEEVKRESTYPDSLQKLKIMSNNLFSPTAISNKRTVNRAMKPQIIIAPLKQKRNFSDSIIEFDHSLDTESEASSCSLSTEKPVKQAWKAKKSWLAPPMIPKQNFIDSAGCSDFSID